jgi:hypothetical protein
MALLGFPAALLALLSAACGGASSPPPTVAPNAVNVAPLIVDAGPSGVGGIVNALYTSVTLCVPGTANCQIIDHVLVDTGSSGLRIVASALNTLPALPARTDAAGDPLAECLVFADGYSWGSVRVADVKLAGETAPGQSIQLIGDTAVPTIAPDCSALGSAQDSVQSLGANGILGLGVFRQDCGALCATSIPSPALYDACPNGVDCQGTLVPTSDQVQNPVWQLPADNAGVIVQLPSIDPAGASSVSGSLILGIDSESNNALGSAAIQTLDSTTGEFVTEYQGQTYALSFFDSGASALFFDDSALPLCPGSGLAPGYYCPATVQGRSAQVLGAGGSGPASSIGFSVANADALLGNSSLYAFASIASPSPLSGGYFTWGLPFFFGRSVYIAIEGQGTSAGTGPFTAYR